jgi:hypothetical protein
MTESTARIVVAVGRPKIPPAPPMFYQHVFSSETLVAALETAAQLSQ